MNHGAKYLWSTVHMPPTVVRALLPSEVWSSYFKFAFVRHPLDWFVSNFYKTYGRATFPARKIIRHPNRIFRAINNYRAMTALSRKPALDASDVDRLHALLRPVRGIPDAATYYQYYFVHDADGVPLLDFVGRFESLEQDIDHIKQRIGLDFDLPHLNRSRRTDYRKCLSPEAVARIRELWDIDFRAFGYTT
jgi:hypothetical protein